MRRRNLFILLGLLVTVVLIIYLVYCYNPYLKIYEDYPSGSYYTYPSVTEKLNETFNISFCGSLDYAIRDYMLYNSIFVKPSISTSPCHNLTFLQPMVFSSGYNSGAITYVQLKSQLNQSGYKIYILTHDINTKFIDVAEVPKSGSDRPTSTAIIGKDIIIFQSDFLKPEISFVYLYNLETKNFTEITNRIPFSYPYPNILPSPYNNGNIFVMTYCKRRTFITGDDCKDYRVYVSDKQNYIQIGKGDISEFNDMFWEDENKLILKEKYGLKRTFVFDISKISNLNR